MQLRENLALQQLTPAQWQELEPLLEPNELLRMVEGFRVWRYEENWQGRGTAAVVAQKPGGPGLPG